MAGTGSGIPNRFGCLKCRASWHRRYKDPEHYGFRWPGLEVELTGKTKPRRHDGNLGMRTSTTSRQYRCKDCGHVGWSTHIDLERTSK